MEQIPLTEKSSASCGCGCAHEDGAPELDVRAIPHAIRHATVFGALGAIKPGQSMVLVAPHDPSRCSPRSPTASRARSA